MRIFIHQALLLLICVAVHAQNPKVIKSRTLMEAGKSAKAIAYLNKAFSKSGEKEIALELGGGTNQFGLTA